MITLKRVSKMVEQHTCFSWQETQERVYESFRDVLGFWWVRVARDQHPKGVGDRSALKATPCILSPSNTGLTFMQRH
jgi:hypothetical protein